LGKNNSVKKIFFGFTPTNVGPRIFWQLTITGSVHNEKRKAEWPKALLTKRLYDKDIPPNKIEEEIIKKFKKLKMYHY
jgi:hypothetical protein